MQASLFDVGAPSFDARLPGLREIDLGGGAWVHHAPRLLRGHAALFRQLRDGIEWHQRQRPMYDKVVQVPRLLARVDDQAATPRIVFQLGHVLCRRYHRPLRHITAACYRDGNDSVAPHGDRVGASDDTVVAILSLGHPRRFLLRCNGDSDDPAHDFALGWGDLLVMGGTCQRTWRHSIPKCAMAGPRISLQYRESGPTELPSPAGSS